MKLSLTVFLESFKSHQNIAQVAPQIPIFSTRVCRLPNQVPLLVAVLHLQAVMESCCKWAKLILKPLIDRSMFVYGAPQVHLTFGVRSLPAQLQ